MKSITFVLNTNATLFANWLGGQTRLLPCQAFGREYTPLLQHAKTDSGEFEFPAESAHITLQAARWSHTKANCISCEGARNVTKDETTTGYPLGEPVYFDVISLSDNPERLQVTGSCTLPAVDEFFYKLLLEIAESYGEAQKVIVAYLDSVLGRAPTGDELDPGFVQFIATGKTESAASGAADKQPAPAEGNGLGKLKPIDSKVLQAIQEIQTAKLEVTNEAIIERMPVSRKGKNPYTDSTVSRSRAKLRRINYNVD